MDKRIIGLLLIILGFIFWILCFFYFNAIYGLEFNFLIESSVSVWSVILISDLVIDFSKAKSWKRGIVVLFFIYVVLFGFAYILSIFFGLSLAVIFGVLLGAIFAVYLEFGRKLLTGKKIE